MVSMRSHFEKGTHLEIASSAVCSPDTRTHRYKPPFSENARFCRCICHIPRMRAFFRTVFCAIMLILSLATAVLADHTAGEVLYHQDFTRVSTASLAGLRVGSANDTHAQIGVREDGLAIQPNGDKRTYAILPEIENTDTYTIDLTFRFLDIHATNGYFAFLLTCTGEKPSNVTAVVFRADGSLDDFGDLNKEIVQHYRDGDAIRAIIPVVDGVLHTVTVSCGGQSQTLERTSLLRIPDGNRGFCVRNANVLIEDTAVLYGTEYEKPTGYYATHSYAEDDGARTDVLSPSTADHHAAFRCMALFSAAVLICTCKRRIRHTS